MINQYSPEAVLGRGVARLSSGRDDAASSVGAHPGVNFAISTDLAEVEQEWLAFEAEAEGTAFQTFAWLSAWQRTIGAASETRPIIVTGRRFDRTLFLLPLAVVRRGPLRHLTWLGGAMCDYNGPLLARDFGKVVGPKEFRDLWQEIGRAIRRAPGLAYDAVVLDKMPAAVGIQPNPFVTLPVMLHPSGAYLTALSGDWESFYTAKRSSTTRRRDRTKRKGLGQFGDVQFRTAAGRAEIETTLNVLFEQKSRSLQAMGATDIFASAAHRAFYTEVAARAVDTPVHVSRLEVGGEVAAANLGLLFHGRYYHVLASYSDEPVSRFGPGAAHLHELMRYAIGRGCTLFDFTIGDEAYKRDWCEIVLKLYDFRSAVTPQGWLLMLPATAGAMVKRFIKQTPLLWRVATRVRSVLADVRQRLRPAARAKDGAVDE